MKRFPDPSVSSSVFHRVVLCALLFSLAGQVSSQETQKRQEQRLRKSADLEQLRTKFEAAVGKDFEFVKGELKGRSNLSGGGTFWLASIKAKHPGSFKLTYRYNDSHYSHVERAFNLNVGRKGCRRGVPNYGSYHRFCLGDTIIFPVAIYNFTEHEFSVTSTEYTVDQDAVWEKVSSELSDESLQRAPANNPLADHLRYVGSSSHKLLHRSGGYTLEGHAVFEARSPGRFNLSLSAAFPDLPSAVLSGIGTGGGTPIIIVSRETPVTLLASSHEVRGYTMGFNGQEYVSSTSGDAYMVDLMILQPGDRISLKYYTTIRSRNYERREHADKDARSDDDAPEKVPPPLISKLPFALKTEYNFTEWLVDYLPH